MASSQDESDWDKSTSEIQSEDSDTLFTSRPNRWRGPPQSWRTLTEEDRLTATALDRLRNQDLAVHLYNAFALKHRPRSPLPQQQSQHDEVAAAAAAGTAKKTWAPPKSWTAWPLQAGLVPPDDLMKRTEDEDDAFTYRRAERAAPSRQLEEVVSAAVLRCARDRFRERQLDGARQGANDDETVNQKPVSSRNNSASSEAASESEDEDGDIAMSAKSPPARGKAVERTYKPAVATDDDVSYALIRPSTRAILSKLEQTLTILHKARETSSRTVDNSAASSAAASETEDFSQDEPARSGRRRARARSHSSESFVASTNRSTSRDATASPSKPKSNRGRKPAAAPREGETEREFLIRRAKEQKKARPVFSDEEENGGESTSAGKSKTRGRRPAARKRNFNADGDEEEEEFWIGKKLDRFRLRDWSDVMGAAALAGFDAKVIERATQRCANLFGQGMEMYIVSEDTGVTTRRYVPGQVVLSSKSDGEQEQEGDQGRHSSRAHSRAMSLVSGDDEDHDGREGRGMESPRKRQKRGSLSFLESGYCHYAGCERATRSFAKPGNLRRHLRTVHGEVDDGRVDTSQATSPRASTSRASTSRATTSRASTPQARTPKPATMFYCTHTDCERAKRPFDKANNFRRHLKLAHGEAFMSEKKAAADGLYVCPHPGCERATQPYPRASHLTRHLKLAHGTGDSTVGGGRQRNNGKQATLKAPPGSAQQEASSDESGSEEESTESEDESSTESDSSSESQ